jgi:uncharacterized DUF497 family protein
MKASRKLFWRRPATLFPVHRFGASGEYRIAVRHFVFPVHVRNHYYVRFEDERCLVYMDRIDVETGEQRWIAIGIAQSAANILVVAHVYREDKYGEEVIRIISAREAEKRDIRRYEAQTLDEG